MKIEVRLATESDIEFELSQTRREGWSTCRERLAMFLAHDPDGCLVAEVDGQPVGMATSTAFALSGWVGNVIVEPAWRGKGIGRQLVERTLDRLGSRGLATMRLDGDPPGVPLYRSLGFVEEYESCRAVGGGPWQVDAVGAEPLTDADWAEVVLLDRRVFGDDRSRLLDLLRASAEAAFVVHLETALAGFAFLTPSLDGVQIGPFLADSPTAARTLLQATLARVGARQAIVGYPELNQEAATLFASHGFLRVPSSLRMVRGRLDAVGEPGLVYGIASGATG